MYEGALSITTIFTANRNKIGNNEHKYNQDNYTDYIYQLLFKGFLSPHPKGSHVLCYLVMQPPLTRFLCTHHLNPLSERTRLQQYRVMM